jgi:hypothetical protein
VDGLVADDALVADLDPERIEEDPWIDRLQRPCLPGRNLVENRVGDGADESGRNLDAVELAQTPPRCPTISRVLMPRAYIDTILSSKPGNLR